MLIGVFAAVAASLAAVGIYGVMACAVAQRTREIGIRLALGAERRRVLALVTTDALAVTVLGVAAGLVGGVLLARALTGLLFGIGALDAVSFGGAALAVAAVAVLAALVPARRATAVDPAITLRCE